jgi:hypothetical protein
MSARGSAEALLGVKARPESTDRQHVHHLAGPLCARGGVGLSSMTRGFKRSRRRQGAGDTTQAKLRRASVDLHESKSVSAFARDDFYIGEVYEVTGPKGRPLERRRQGRCGGAITRAASGEEPYLCSRPEGEPWCERSAPARTEGGGVGSCRWTGGCQRQ